MGRTVDICSQLDTIAIHKPQYYGHLLSIRCILCFINKNTEAFSTLYLPLCAKFLFSILGVMYWAFFQAFRSTTLLISIFVSAKIYIISRKFPRFKEDGDLSWPLKVQPWNASHRTPRIEVSTCKQFFSTSSLDMVCITLSIC